MTHDELDPADDARVRHLLAAARHTDPLPTEVADRLDRVVVGLVAERREASDVLVVVSLESRRRRRWATGLVAAAAAMVLGVSLTSLTDPLGLSDESPDTASGAGEADESEREAAAAEGPNADSQASAPGAPQPPAEALSQVQIRPDRFKRDAAAARERATYDTLARPEVCGTVPANAEQVVPVRYADREGYLVFGVSASGGQPVRLYLCPAGEFARRATISAP